MGIFKNRKTKVQKRAEIVNSKADKIYFNLNNDLNNFQPKEKVLILLTLLKKIKGGLKSDYEGHMEKSKELTEAISRLPKKQTK